MTSAPVTNSTDMMYVVRKDSAPSPRGEKNFAGDLKNAVEKNGQKTEAASKQEDGKNPIGKANATEKDQGMKAVTEQKIPKETSAGETADVKEQPFDEVVDTVKASVKDIIQALKKMTDLDEDDILLAMENLGIQSIDLIKPEVLTNLLMELSGTEDSMELVTNESLYNTLQDLNTQVSDIVKELTEELSMAPESLQEVMEQVALKIQEEAAYENQKEVLPIADDTVDIFTKNDAMAVNVSLSEIVADKTISTSETQNQTDVNTAEVQSTETKSIQPETSYTTVKKEQPESEEQGSMMEEQQSHAPEQADVKAKTETDEGTVKRNSFERHVGNTEKVDENPTILGQQPTQTEELYVAEQRSEESVSYTQRNERTQQIADQILEQMKVLTKEDVTELEMQLHPASLGNVNVSLVSREGNITAQFTAQNEAVRSAIEAQIVQLKEQFEEQGIKVDAVEVAVADHQFDHGNSDSEQREFQRKQVGSRRTRRINLEALNEEELAQILDDTDKIQVDMMTRNGNTVDYTV